MELDTKCHGHEAMGGVPVAELLVNGGTQWMSAETTVAHVTLPGAPAFLAIFSLWKGWPKKWPILNFSTWVMVQSWIEFDLEK
jgi:hypothetical protein